METRLPRFAAAAAAWLLAGSLAHTDAAERWWNPAWSVRRKVTCRGRTSYPGSDICYAEFYTGGFMQKNGADVRVTESGRLIPHRVLFVGPGDFAKILIKADKTPRTQRTFYVYYGNPKAKPMTYGFEIQRGLLLEVRHYKGGGCNNWRQMQATLRKSEGAVMNRGFIDTIDYGYNPFGPSVNCVSVYRGWFMITRPGPYTFAITSDDASFFFIDGKLTIQYPGVHRAVRDARKHRTVNLRRGLHKLEFYHLQLGAYMAAVVAWRPPWEKNKRRFRIMPKTVFTQPLWGSVSHYERRDRAPSPDFSAKKAGEAYVKGQPMVRIEFRDQSWPIVSRPAMWDFGDGQTAQGGKVQHVYLAPGLYKVTMRKRLGRSVRSISQVIDAFQDWKKQTSRRTDSLSSYYSTISRYNFAKLDSRSLVTAARYFEKLSKWRDAVKVSAVLFTRATEIDAPTLYERMAAYGEILSKRLRQHRAAIRVLEKAENVIKPLPYKARLAIAAGYVALRGSRNPQEAVAHFNRVLAKYEKAGSDARRRALIGIGDAFRQQGEHDKAFEKYQQAQQIPVSGQPYHKRAVRIGAFSRAIEYYLRTRRPRDLEAAEQYLDQWEWEYPTEKLLGYSTVLRGKLYFIQRRYDEAIAELEEFIAVSPQSHYVGDALIELAKCYYAKRDPAKARNVLQTLVSDYRDSDKVPLAKEMLKKNGIVREPRKRP